MVASRTAGHHPKPLGPVVDQAVHDLRDALAKVRAADVACANAIQRGDIRGTDTRLRKAHEALEAARKGLDSLLEED